MRKVDEKKTNAIDQNEKNFLVNNMLPELKKNNFAQNKMGEKNVFNM